MVRITETASESATVSEGATVSEDATDSGGDSGNSSIAPATPLAVSPGSAGAVAMETVNRILTTAGVNVVSTLRSANDPDVGGPVIDLSGEDSGLLIGRRGQTLQSLQLLVNMITRKEIGDDVRVALDVEHYRQRREASLRDMASKVASRVVQTGHSITLEPMSPADRRVVHVSLSDYQGVRTESSGFGDDRKISIISTSQDPA